ncbi:MAG: NAD-dependent epimerase/dehydratase family protein [Acidimicrobiia bacterium]
MSASPPDTQAALAALASLGGTTCVVTGGLGFIGSNVALALAHAGARVRVVDALVPAHGGDRRNLGERSDIEVLEADLGDPRVAEVVADADIVFNIAGQVSHHASMTDPLRDLDLNVRSHLALLETLRAVNPTVRIVYTSTRQVYGRPERIPVEESHPARPVDVNGVDKLACEQLHLLYGKVHGLRPTALRLTNVYGPRQNLVKEDLGALPVFVRRSLRGEVIRLFGDGSQRRDCLHVDDVVRALGAAATTDAAVGAVVNIGHERSWTLREIADALIGAVVADGGPHSEVELVPWPPELSKIDIGNFETDTRLATRLLGWRPLVTLEDGARDTVVFYRRHPWYLSSI